LTAHGAPVLVITCMAEPWWTRKVRPGDRRSGQWLTAEYEVIDSAAWHRRGACLYTLTGADGNVRYVGISVNRLKDRWRTSPAREVGTNRDLDNRLFHSQCWRWLMVETETNTAARFELRAVSAEALAELTGYPDAYDQLVRRVELELIGQQSATFAPWNGRQPTR
jgi:hypothetical protein